MQSNVYVGIKPSNVLTNPLIDSNNNILKNNLNNSNILPNNITNNTNFNITDNFDFILSPITNSRYKETVKSHFDQFLNRTSKNRNININNNTERNGIKYGINSDKSYHFETLTVPEPQLQELSISPFNEISSNQLPTYIGLLSSWLELENSDTDVRELAFQVLFNECKYANYIGVKKLILAPPKDLINLQYYSQIVFRLLNTDVFQPDFEKNTISSSPNSSTNNMILSISLPLSEDSDPLATWELWNTIRKFCDYHPSLTISLAIPRFKIPNFVLDRWICEPVSCLLISSSIFINNRYDYPVLHKFNQNIIRKFQEINGNSQIKSNDLCILLHGMEKYSKFVNGGENSYLEYINYLLKKGDKLILTEKVIDGFEIPQLLPPLKPHSKKLTNDIYSTFEKDKIKYDLYELAINNALLDLQLILNKSKPLNILIAGAGRGPIVDRVYRIVTNQNILNRVKIWAIEKNSAACLYLQKRNFEFWDNQITLINEDMTTWIDPDVKINLCISELLGSLGCNELAPECLLSIEKNHSTPNTIFIPQSYTSYIAPISSPLLYQKLTDLSKTNNCADNYNNINYLESPWVGHKIPYQILSGKVNELWTFSHPLKDQNFTQSKTTEFKIKHRGEIHGLVGFFTAKLYDDSTILSIVPTGQTIKTVKPMTQLEIESLQYTTDLISWSPLFFPLRQPMTITDDTEISVLISRIHREKKTWFEWSLESFIYLVVSENKVPKTLRPSSLKNHRFSTNNDDSTTSNKIPNYHDVDQKEKNENPSQFRNFSQPVPDIEQFSVDLNEFDQDYDKGTQGTYDGNNYNNNGKTAFPSLQENAWQSVNDIHGWVTQDNIETSFSKDKPEAGPLFNLNATNHETNNNNNTFDRMENTLEESELSKEVHIRIPTGVSSVHNINGRYFHIPL